MDLADLLKLKPADLPPYTVLVGHGYLQLAELEYDGSHKMHYPLSLLPSDLSKMSYVMRVVLILILKILDRVSRLKT